MTVRHIPWAFLPVIVGKGSVRFRETSFRSALSSVTSTFLITKQSGCITMTPLSRIAWIILLSTHMKGVDEKSIWYDCVNQVSMATNGKNSEFCKMQINQHLEMIFVQFKWRFIGFQRLPNVSPYCQFRQRSRSCERVKVIWKKITFLKNMDRRTLINDSFSIQTIHKLVFYG